MFKNMRIWMRLVLGFSAVIVLMIIMILVGIVKINSGQDYLKRIVEMNNARIINSSKMGDIARDNAISMRNIILAGNDIGKIKEQRDSIDTRRKIYDEANRLIHRITPSEDTANLKILSLVDVTCDSTRADNDKIITMILTGKYTEAKDLLNGKAYLSRIKWENNIDNLIACNIDRNNLRYHQAEKAASDARALMIVLGLAALLISLIIVYFLTRFVTRSVKVATTLVTTRDLSLDISTYMEGRNEFAQMIRSFSKDISERLRLEKEVISYKDQLEIKLKQLSAVLVEVRETVNVIASSSAQILAAITQVASGTVETSSAITETTTTVEEVQQAAKQTAQKAKNVADSAQKVAQVSQDGQKSVEETVSVMNRIREQMDSIAQTIVRLSEHSQSIGGIIASVTEIADQSNLLAVNASIEAAKAGEYGKGFVVVAQEIRNLAGQSKQATIEVKNILNDVQKATSAAVLATEQGSKAVESGVKQSVQAGEAIRILAERIDEAVQAATQIAASSQQQVVGMDQIGIAMQNINQASAETASSMMQSEKSVKDLHELGQKLKDMVERFKE